MKLALIADTHLGQQDDLTIDDNLLKLEKDCDRLEVEALCVAGDIGDGTLLPDLGSGRRRTYQRRLGRLFRVAKEHLYVVGNHDLYSPQREKLTPDKALRRAVEEFNEAGGTPLESWWVDERGLVLMGDHAFVGTLGFPDFTHPGLIGSRQSYVAQASFITIDAKYIELDDWLSYTDALNAAFLARLSAAAAIKGVKSVVVLTHYPCLCGQSSETIADRVWPYFYNYRLGIMIREAASANLDKTFYAVAGHSHEYCRGYWVQEMDNLYALGLTAQYRRFYYTVIDTSESVLAMPQMPGSNHVDINS